MLGGHGPHRRLRCRRPSLPGAAPSAGSGARCRPGLDGVRAVFERLGSIQFDPLAVAGRNHDLVLHARVARLRPGLDERAALRASRALRDLQQDAQPAAHQRAALAPADLGPLPGRAPGGRLRARTARRWSTCCERLRAEGPLSSLDFERRATVDWYWGPTSEVRAVLEALPEAGIVGLARRDGNRRYFDLTERLYPRRAAGDQRPIRARAAAPQAAVALSRPRPARRGRPDGALVRHRAGTPRAVATRPAPSPAPSCCAELVEPWRARAGHGRRRPRHPLRARARSWASSRAAEAEIARTAVRSTARASTFLAPLDSARLGSRPAAQPLRLRLRLGGLRAAAPSGAGATTCCPCSGATGWSAASSRASTAVPAPSASSACGGRTASGRAAGGLRRPPCARPSRPTARFGGVRSRIDWGAQPLRAAPLRQPASERGRGYFSSRLRRRRR